MLRRKTRWLDSMRHYEGQKPGETLVAWLNESQFTSNFVEQVLADAQFVYEYADEYRSLTKLLSAHKHEKLPTEFWDFTTG